jgi:phage gp36-like protein
MSYATQTDLIARYGQDHIMLLADLDGDDVIDATMVERCLEQASAEIDLYLGVRHTLPLPSVPEAVKRFCIEMARYYLASDSGRLTEDIRKRYEDVIKTLGLISKGSATLGLPSEQQQVSSVVNPFVREGRSDFRSNWL